jgi:hypothetical protein
MRKELDDRWRKERQGLFLSIYYGWSEKHSLFQGKVRGGCGSTLFIIIEQSQQDTICPILHYPFQMLRDDQKQPPLELYILLPSSSSTHLFEMVISSIIDRFSKRLACPSSTTRVEIHGLFQLFSFGIGRRKNDRMKGDTTTWIRDALSLEGDEEEGVLFSSYSSSL